MAFIEARGIFKSYHKKRLLIPVLEGLDLDVESGEFLALMGPSGSGKSTLLNLLGGLDVVDDGSIRVGDARLDQMSEGRLTIWRSRHCGFIFQMYHLLPVLTAQQNVELPLLLFRGMSAGERRRRALAALEIVGLKDRADHKPGQLSGGQEQRVAIARALVTDPDLLLADEPTGDLDSKSSVEVLDLIGRLNREFGKTIIMVTHDQHAAERAGRVVHLDKGRLAATPELAAAAG